MDDAGWIAHEPHRSLLAMRTSFQSPNWIASAVTCSIVFRSIVIPVDVAVLPGPTIPE